MITNGVLRRMGWGEAITCVTGGHFGSSVCRTKAQHGYVPRSARWVNGRDFVQSFGNRGRGSSYLTEALMLLHGAVLLRAGDVRSPEDLLLSPIP